MSMSRRPGVTNVDGMNKIAIMLFKNTYND